MVREGTCATAKESKKYPHVKLDGVTKEELGDPETREIRASLRALRRASRKAESAVTNELARAAAKRKHLEDALFVESRRARAIMAVLRGPPAGA